MRRPSQRRIALRHRPAGAAKELGDGWVGNCMNGRDGWTAGMGSSTRQLPWTLARDEKWIDFPQILGDRPREGEEVVLSRRMGPRGHESKTTEACERIDNASRGLIAELGIFPMLAARGWLALVHVRPYMTMYVQGHVDIREESPFMQSCKPQAAKLLSPEPAKSAPHRPRASFTLLSFENGGRVCARDCQLNASSRSGDVLGHIHLFRGHCSSRHQSYRTPSHRKCSAINAMLTATQARTHARACTEPPIVRSSWCVAEPSLTAAPTDELMGNVWRVAGT